MSKIEKIITENYQDALKLISLIQKYDFENFLNGTLSEIELAINNSDIKRLSELATASLIRINENLKGINHKEKEQLEYLLSDIFQTILVNVDSPEALSNIQETIISACKISGYDYEILEQMLGFKKQQILKPRPNNKGLPYYKWYGLDYELNSLLDFLIDAKLILNKKNFKKIFSPISDPFDYIGIKENIADLILVFTILKQKDLIKPKTSSGHFTPLVRYGVDNEGAYLFKKAPNKIHEYLKRNKDVYAKLKDKYEAVIRNIAEKTLRQRMDNGQSTQ